MCEDNFKDENIGKALETEVFTSCEEPPSFD